MREQTRVLAEAVRRLEIKGDGGSCENVRLGVRPQDLKPRLYDLKRALDAFDASANGESEEDRSARLMDGIDALVRWCRMRGLDADEMREVLIDAMAPGGRKDGRRLRPLPRFAPEAWRKKRQFKPRLRLEFDHGRRIDAAAVREQAVEIRYVSSMLGAAAPGGFGSSSHAEE